MGKVRGMIHSGRPNKDSNIYTRTNRKTGKCYSVEIRNPITEWTEAQSTMRKKFGVKNSAISRWIRENQVESAEGYAAYRIVKRRFDRQNAYATLRGYMMAKGMAEILPDGQVKITIDKYSTCVNAIKQL